MFFDERRFLSRDHIRIAKRALTSMPTIKNCSVANNTPSSDHDHMPKLGRKGECE